MPSVLRGVELLGAEVGEEQAAVVGIGAFAEADAFLNDYGCLRHRLLLRAGRSEEEYGQAGHGNCFFHICMILMVWYIQGDGGRKWWRRRPQGLPQLTGLPDREEQSTGLYRARCSTNLEQI